MEALLSKMKGNPGARVARSASQYSVNIRYSNRAKFHGSPASCVSKLGYDFQMNATGKSRVMFAYISRCDEHAIIERDPIAFAKACELTSGRQRNCRQMKHVMIALPAVGLSDRGQNDLAKDICDMVRHRYERQPVFGAVHCPSSGSSNFHLHLSHGLREIHMQSDSSYTLGKRIMSEERPGIRRSAGLPATSHRDLQEFRAKVADLIANALAREEAEPHLVERWRHGHLKIDEQVRKAVQREDWDFVQDNGFRDPTDHEWYSGDARGRNMASPTADVPSSPNKHIQNAVGVGAKVLLKELLLATLSVAKRRKMRGLEYFRLLAMDHDLIVRWTRRRRKNGSKGAIVGLSYQVIGGPVYSGRSIGMPLSRICDELGVRQGTYHIIDDEQDSVDAFLGKYPPLENELRQRFEGRLTTIALLYILSRKADWSLRDSASAFANSQVDTKSALTSDSPGFRRIVGELSIPLSEADLDARDEMLLQHLDSDELLRTYVACKRQIRRNAFSTSLAENIQHSNQMESITVCDNSKSTQSEPVHEFDVHTQKHRMRN